MFLITNRDTSDKIEIGTGDDDIGLAGHSLILVNSGGNRLDNSDLGAVGLLPGSESNGETAILGTSRDSGDDVFTIEIPLGLGTSELNLRDKVKIGTGDRHV